MNQKAATIDLLELIYTITKKYNTRPALQIKDKQGTISLTYDQLRERSVAFSAYLIKHNIGPQTHIAILSENRPQWAVAFFGIISAACVTIPIDAKLSMTEIIFILNNAKVECLVVSGKFFQQIALCRGQLPLVKNIFCFDSVESTDVVCFDDLKFQENETPNRPDDINLDAVALIVYTSGTTGVAKGVVLTYKSLLFEAQALYDLMLCNRADSFVSILPLNHMLEITGGLIAPLYGGATITYCSSLKPAHIIAAMREAKATGMICVPLVLKMFYNGITREVEKQSGAKRIIFSILFFISKGLLRLGIRCGKLFFSTIHRQFGKAFKFFISGGAPLDIVLEKNFDALGFRILQGYGLSETAPVVALNTLRDHRYGSVGKPLTGVEIKLQKTSGSLREGEILVKGPNVMQGYLNNPEKTAEVLKDSWYYTGDLGYVDKEGFLFISGRAKNLIVLGGGKKVFPEEVEQVIQVSPYIKEMCVFGKKAKSGLKEGTEEVYAVIVPDCERFSQEELKDENNIRKYISQEIARLSSALADYKKISDFMIYREELPKTATRKIKRKEVIALLKDQ
jgi:long-chain acyl-CoA synthetase